MTMFLKDQFLNSLFTITTLRSQDGRFKTSIMDVSKRPFWGKRPLWMFS